MNSLNKNIISLTFIQLLRFVVPLLTFPYLTRVLGVTGFGYLGFAYAIIGYGIIFSLFGYNLTATSRIAQIKNRKNKLDVYCSTIYVSRIILSLNGVLLIALFLFLYADTTLTVTVIYMSVMIVGDILVPTWLFQGLEKMKELSFFTFLGRLLTVPFIFILVNDRGDIYVAAFLQGMSFVVTGFFCSFYIFKNSIFHWKRIKLRYLYAVVSSSWSVFITTVASSLYLNFLTIVIGMVGNVTSVGYFNVAQNIRNICIQCFTPVYQSTYPRISFLLKTDFKKACDICRKFIFLCLLVSSLLVLFINLFTDNILQLLVGKEFLQAGLAVKIVSISIILSVANNYLGVQTMIPSGFSKSIKDIVLKASFFCLFLSFPIVYYFDYVGAAAMLTMSEMYIFINLIVFHKKQRINIFFKYKQREIS